MMQTVRSLKVHDWAYLAISLVFLGLVILDGFIFHSPLSRVGDVIEHIAAIDAWLERPLSPENPALNSAASSPRFIPVYFPFVLLGSVLGWSAWFTYDVICLLGGLLFLLSIRMFAKSIHTSPLAPIFALIIFTSFWTNPWNFSSVYEFSTVYRIAGYPSIIAFSFSLIILSVLLKALKTKTISRRHWAVLAGLTALVWATHILTGAFLISAAALYILFHGPASIKFRASLIGAGLLGLALTVFWPFYPVWNVALGSGSSGQASWVTSLSFSPQRAPYITTTHPFYEYGRILPLALGLACAIYGAIKRQFIPLLGMLGFLLIYIANIYVRIPLGHRFVIYALFFGHVAITIVSLDVWTKYSPSLSRNVKRGLAILALCVFTGISFTGVKPHLKPAKTEIIARNLALQAATNESSVLAGSLREIWTVSAYDRKVLSLLHPNPLVSDTGQRSVANAILVSNYSSDDMRALVQNCYGVTHLVLSTGHKWRKNEDTIALADKLAAKGLKVSDVAPYTKLVELGPPQSAPSCQADAEELMRDHLNVIYGIE